MLKDSIRFLRGDSYVSNRDEVGRQNRMAIRYFAAAGIPVGIVNFIAQSLVRGAPPALSLQGYWLPAYFALLFLLERLVIPQECRHSTLLVYALEAPVMIVTILLGTVWDPSHQAMTFLLFMLAMPVFILDRPVRVIAVMLGWNIVFLGLCVLVKTPDTLRPDTLHALEFFLLSVAITYVVLRLRFEVIESLERTRYHLEHDAITDTQNQRCLVTNMQRYLNRRLFVTLGDIDHFSLINDFYGHEIGDDVLYTFAGMLKETFGYESTYRYGGDEVLAFLCDRDADDGPARISACQSDIAAYRPKGMHMGITSSFGFVMGTPTTTQELQQMIQLADIYKHQTKRKGEGKVIGGPFDQAALAEGIAKSSISTHARSYEVNQLTGLPTMAYFITRTSELMQSVVDKDRRPVIGYFNIVRFHDFNDEFGYSKGDDLIRTTALLLADAFPRRFITYMSGSQFGLLCYIEEIERGMTYLSQTLYEYMPGHPLFIKAGFVECQESCSVISLLDKAKLAHESIQDRRDVSYRMYDDALDDEIRFRQYLITHLDEAIENEWIKVYYQPIIDVKTGAICSREALARWDDPTYGFLSPVKFIGVLERERLVYKLSRYVVRRVLADFDELERLGVPCVPVSINLSRSDFFECDIVEDICKMVDDSGRSRNMLSIEITESAFSENQGLLKSEVDRLRSLGFAVWMDDFGSEYSTLNLLEELTFDVVKVDMRFMRNYTEGGRNAIILEEILSMCHRLGIATLVEGIETQEQYESMRKLGSDMLQGYLFSRPQPMRSFITG